MALYPPFDPTLVREEDSLGEKQELFCYLKGRWMMWVYARGWRLRPGEGRILPMGPDGRRGRRARIVDSSEIVHVEDRVHKVGGLHYLGLAEDFQLFVPGEPNGGWISDGSHPAWREAGLFWESLHPLAFWGGNWDKDEIPFEEGESDSNHLSIRHQGKK
jgi:hypothetical protein